MTGYSSNDLINPKIPNGVFCSKETENQLIIFFSTVLSLLDCGTIFQTNKVVVLAGSPKENRRYVHLCRTLCHIACPILVWLVWKERNPRIFENKVRSEEAVWDLLYFYSTLWASSTSVFKRVPFVVLQLNWLASCVSPN